MKLYLDANVVIYAHEAQKAVRATVLRKMVGVVRSPGGILMTSLISRLECRVKPLRHRDVSLLAEYDNFFADFGPWLLDVSAPFIEIATDLRVRYNFKSPDAIHLATAIHHQVDIFLTNDQQLERCTDVNVEAV